MNSISVGNVPEDNARVGIDYHDVRAARNVNAPPLTIDRQIIPATFAPQFDCLRDMITRRTGHDDCCCDQ